MKNESVPQPVHLHGFRFWVLSQGVYDPKVMNETDEINNNNTTSNNNNTTNTTEDDVGLPQPSDSGVFTRLNALNLFTKDKLNRNFYHPILKDTIVIPAAGYAIVRFKADNKGKYKSRTTVSQDVQT